jgi:hypothetical protein
MAQESDMHLGFGGEQGITRRHGPYTDSSLEALSSGSAATAVPPTPSASSPDSCCARCMECPKGTDEHEPARLLLSRLKDWVGRRSTP